MRRLRAWISRLVTRVRSGLVFLLRWRLHGISRSLQDRADAKPMNGQGSHWRYRAAVDGQRAIPMTSRKLAEFFVANEFAGIAADKRIEMPAQQSSILWPHF